MKALVCREYGPPETLTYEDLPAPEVGDKQVRIQVHACGVNFPDTLIIEGKYQLKPEMPFSPGAEVAGVVESVGSAVTRFKSGDRVIAMAGWGGYAEQLVTDEERVTSLPESMDFVTGAGFSMAYGTSMHALRQRARLQSGETLLVLGAGGGVGLAAVEIGRNMGARVIAAAGSQEKLDIARAAGATETINYHEESIKDRVKELTGGRGADVIYDAVGGDAFDESLRCINWNGRLLVVGFASGRIPQAPANLPLLKGSSIVGVFWGRFRAEEPEEDRKNFQTLFDWHAAGQLKPHISHTLPLSQGAEAMRVLTNREAIGKVILQMA
ncbi:NADPH:quinone oxidoreductase family protein [Salinicola salarius]|uniref:NADPH:quinone oxidoreductase family protein n=1 Tax=Salinicola salarius TaxID=430457 RepID=UPI000B400551|nr:NADPH:quinone oxidoreductase family protein [Salinicola salarius]